MGPKAMHRHDLLELIRGKRRRSERLACVALFGLPIAAVVGLRFEWLFPWVALVPACICGLAAHIAYVTGEAWDELNRLRHKRDE